MFAITLGFANLLVASLVVGAMFGAWLMLNPRGLDGPRYVVLHQQGIRTLNTALPALGAATFVLTLAAAAMARRDGPRLALLVVAAIGFLAAGVITRRLNQPINRQVMTWSTAAPPAEWTRLRDTWWRWHVARLLCGLGGLSGLILADVLRGAGS